MALKRKKEKEEIYAYFIPGDRLLPCFFFFLFFGFFVCFLGVHTQHMKIPRLEVELDLQPVGLHHSITRSKLCL